MLHLEGVVLELVPLEDEEAIEVQRKAALERVEVPCGLKLVDSLVELFDKLLQRCLLVAREKLEKGLVIVVLILHG